jgi:hypothetical protein
MPRPFPTLPRGPGRRGAARAPAGQPRQHLLGCPKVSPEWELGALRALMKPHDWTRGAVAHRPAEQPWRAGAAAEVEAAFDEVVGRLKPHPPPRLHFPEAGDFRFVVEAAPDQLDPAKALAVVLSKRLPGVWITLGRLYVRDGHFFRRKRDNTFKFRLVPSTNVHLPREVRAALCGLV